MSSFVTSLVCLFSALALSALGYTLTGETQTMRRERSGADSEVEINSNAHISVAPEFKHLMTKQKAANLEYCLFDYSSGTPSTSVQCSTAHATAHALILDRDMCIKAADRAGAKTDHANFHVEGEAAENAHPKGCFKAQCTVDATQTCYFYNGVAQYLDDNAARTGTPVCSFDRYKNGTTFTGVASLVEMSIDGGDDGNGDGNAAAATPAPPAPTDFHHATAQAWNGGCPNGYEVMMDWQECNVATKCLDYCEGQYFHIGRHNGSRHLDFPLGCFINTKAGGDGCVYFNTPSTMGVPTNSYGTNLCKAQ